jgi:uncharacterized DUF497 family protein
MLLFGEFEPEMQAGLRHGMWYKSYTGPRFQFDARKDRQLRENRGIGFADAEEIFRHRYFLSYRSENPEQLCATGWVNGRMYSLVYEIRRDKEGEFYHLVTLWKATKEEIALYEENA